MADDNTVVCAKCGQSVEIGQWPFCPHGRMASYHPFIPYFDIGLGVEITSHAERWTHMRRLHMDYRDKVSKGELAARADRIEERKKEEAR